MTKKEKELHDIISKFYLSGDWKKMRNCPFCGNGKKSLFMASDRFGSSFWIACETSDYGCGATGPEASTPEEAAKLWNFEPEVRRGRWIPTEYDSYADGNPVYDAFECSECGHEHSGTVDTLTAYCPDCGAQMEEVRGYNGCDQTTSL